MAKKKVTRVEKKLKEKTSKELADAIFPTFEEDLEESVLDIPPEQRKLHTETYDFSISTLVDHLKSGHIFIPEFQREYVWNDSQASRLIESLIIQCPIPVIYLSQTNEEKLSVIDGNQRLTSIRRFVNGQFSLRGLTTYPELEGNSFDELDERFKRHITNRTLRCIVILKETHPQVKFDVFERLNTGSVKLNAQELRHGIYWGPLAKAIEDMAIDPKWIDTIGSSNTKRMKSDELILRFFALSSDLPNYKKPLLHYLNKFLESNRALKKDKIEILKNEFEESFEVTKKIFGEYSFRIVDSKGEPSRGFNAAAYDAQMIAVLFEVVRKGKKIKSPEGVQKDYLELFEEEKFKDAIQRATSDDQALKFRVQSLSSILKKHAK